jgi:hypothetical protein
LIPATPALRREQVKLQVGLANVLYHSKGVAAAETISAFNQARVMIEHAESLGEHIEDPLLLYSVLYGFFIPKFINFDGDAASVLARQFLALAEQQNATAPIMVGHRLLGMTLLVMGDAAEALSHLDSAWALYDPAAHRPLATRFGQDVGATTLTFRPLALWLLGYPKTALEETEGAITAARKADHMPTLLFALACTAFTHICCRALRRQQPYISTNVPLWRRRRFRSSRCLPARSGVASWPRPARRLTQSKRSVPKSLACGQLAQRHGVRSGFRIWLWLMQRLENSMMLGVALARQ